MSKDLTIQSIREKLEALAKRRKTRAGFNKAALKEFPQVGQGSYRVALDAGDYVIKLRLTDKQADWSADMVLGCNSIERKNWMALSNEFQFFVMEPIYIVLPNDHDAVIMRKATVCTGFVNVGAGWTDIMSEQYRFIKTAFADTHEGNIGWSVTEQRVCGSSTTTTVPTMRGGAIRSQRAQKTSSRR